MSNLCSEVVSIEVWIGLFAFSVSQDPNKGVSFFEKIFPHFTFIENPLEEFGRGKAPGFSFHLYLVAPGQQTIIQAYSLKGQFPLPFWPCSTRAVSASGKC